ncbi:MAG: hypothetical protein U9N58_08965 [Thermodesulfobacteriota bacterium]|nr:hypothetical protein [Thermodesulfobacteriota bacterium]
MKLQFDTKLDSQREAINDVVDITGDRQLGMTRHFFSEGVQERFAQSRFNVLRGLRITWINSPRARSQEKYGLYWNRNRE